MDLPSFPHETSVQSLIKWSEESAEHEIERLQRHIKFDQTKQRNNEKEWKRDLFLDPKKRGQWIDLHFKSHRKGPPEFAIDGETDEKTKDPKKVKEIYLKEGTIFLKKKLQPPGPEEEKEAKYEPTPSLSPRENKIHTLPTGSTIYITSMVERNLQSQRKGRRYQHLGWIDEGYYPGRIGSHH